MLNNWLNARAVTQFHPVQEKQVQPLLRRLVCLIDDPHPFEKVKRSIFINTASSMLKLAYGYTLQADDDPVFQDIHLTTKNSEVAGMFTNFLVNVFPLLSYVPHWFPGAGWKRTAYRWRQQKERALSVPYEWTKAQIVRMETSIASGTAEPSILGALLQSPNLTSHLKEEEKERSMKEVAFIIVGAGTDTTSTALVAFVAAMVLNPDVQAKAQKELDSVLGPTSLPTMSDRERLPYMRKLIQEVLRWQPTVPTEWVHMPAVPHACWRDDNYEGYDIKKGTVVIGNVWLVLLLLSASLAHGYFRAITRDENIYKDPEAFNPDRFQDLDVPHAPVFGWGRRKCPGIYFAEASLFITIASLLATFTFSRKREPDGQEIVPKIENMSNALVMELKPFEFELKLRSPSHRQLISE
ncbi:cytochrome p450 [Rhizoctonia solani]|uniref:Cytochrome p450 n=1 Tax=Rhizoctonia solani TaxID=456999 RepID=A0A8H7LFM9_9AGAM|nr:cytochrome p450 [Rhizoctonia solani]